MQSSWTLSQLFKKNTPGISLQKLGFCWWWKMRSVNDQQSVFVALLLCACFQRLLLFCFLFFLWWKNKRYFLYLMEDADSSLGSPAWCPCVFLFEPPLCQIARLKQLGDPFDALYSRENKVQQWTTPPGGFWAREWAESIRQGNRETDHDWPGGQGFPLKADRSCFLR